MENEVAMVGLIAIYAVAMVFFIAIIWKIYAKANQPGWASIIPIYSTIVWLKIIGRPAWWVLLLIIPVVNIVFAIIMTNLLAKSFGKGMGFTAGLIFLPLIFYPILAFGDAKYQGPIKLT